MAGKLIKLVCLLLVLVSCDTSFQFTKKFKDNSERTPRRLLVVYEFGSDIKESIYKLKDSLRNEMSHHGTITVPYGRSDFDLKYFDSLFIENECNGYLCFTLTKQVNKTYFYKLDLVSIKNPFIDDTTINKTIWKAEFRFTLNKHIDSRMAMLKNNIIEGLYK
jgi:hypothetical protein